MEKPDNLLEELKELKELKELREYFKELKEEVKDIKITLQEQIPHLHREINKLNYILKKNKLN